MQGGSNLPRVGDYNRVLIVDLVRRNPGISRVELSERTGLTSQTITNICEALAGQGLIEEAGRVVGGSGRPRTTYRVIPSGRHAVGLHIDPARAVLALVDLAGEVVARSSLEMPVTADPQEDLDAIALGVRALVEDNGIALPDLSGLGVAAPGPIAKGSGTVVSPPNLRGWDVVRLRDELGVRLGIPVELEKDTVAAVTGELWAGTAPSDDFLFVYLGTGTGGGIVLNGEVAHGSSGNLGNFGHLIGDPEGPLCECGARGCIGVSAAPLALVRRGVQTGVIAPPASEEAPAVEHALGQLAARADEGVDAARGILDDAARAFGRVAGNLVTVLDLDAVVFGGPNWPWFEESFLRIVPGVIRDLHVFRAVHGVSVGASALGEDVGPMGAASLVLANAVSARPAMLLAPV